MAIARLKKELGKTARSLTVGVLGAKHVVIDGRYCERALTKIERVTGGDSEDDDDSQCPI